MRKLAAALALFSALIIPSFAWAQLDPAGTGLTETGNQVYGEQDPQSLKLSYFIGANIIRPVIGLTGILFLVLTVYAGVLWMTAAGDEKQVSRAKNILIASVIGAAIIASAYVITTEVLNALNPATVCTEGLC